MKLALLAILFSANLQSLFAMQVQPLDQIVKIQVTVEGFEPSSVEVKSGVPVVLEVTRTTDVTCAKEIVIPAKKIKRNLPLNEPVTLALGRLKKGKLHFACGMDMVTGVIIIK